MYLYLLRHGEANSTAVDTDPSLSPHGCRQLHNLNTWIQEHNFKTSSIWHSTKKRAKETAEILSHALSSKNGLLEREDLKPNSSVEPIVNEINLFKEDLTIVTHLPFIEKLACSLLFNESDKNKIAFTTAKLIILHRTHDVMWNYFTEGPDL